MDKNCTFHPSIQGIPSDLTTEELSIKLFKEGKEK